ncbi:MAG: hypothetical protein JSS43_13760 [Proteobacteria bacterium]|nr:hypothetical protein [Pseudomonadota bacterium]
MRAEASLAALPVILAASVQTAGLRADAADFGITYVLAKPVRQRVLIRVIGDSRP